MLYDLYRERSWMGYTRLGYNHVPANILLTSLPTYLTPEWMLEEGRHPMLVVRQGV